MGGSNIRGRGLTGADRRLHGGFRKLVATILGVPILDNAHIWGVCIGVRHLAKLLR